MNPVIPIVSGGMDSVTLAYELVTRGREIPAVVSFNYGQRHACELRFAEECSRAIGAEWLLIDLREITGLLGGSALTDPTVAVPDGHYAEDSMRITVVPNRNMIMMAIAAGIATAKKVDTIAVAVHAGDHFIYPDCRPNFINAMQQALASGTEGFGNIKLQAPFIWIDKAEIVRTGASNGTPYGRTWSCYKGSGQAHCGRCGTCVERKEAFREAAVIDPTEYEDPEYKVEAYRG